MLNVYFITPCMARRMSAFQAIVPRFGLSLRPLHFSNTHLSSYGIFNQLLNKCLLGAIVHRLRNFTLRTA